tara:strand:- start:62 stop:601 length:540 start_codon:yes stop_codon:yes gene_type:complete
MGSRKLSFEQSVKVSSNSVLAIIISFSIGSILLLSGDDILTNGTYRQRNLGYSVIFLGLTILHVTILSGIYAVLSLGVAIAFGKNDKSFTTLSSGLWLFSRSLMVPLTGGSILITVLVAWSESHSNELVSLMLIALATMAYLMLIIPIFVKIIADGFSKGLQLSGFYTQLNSFEKNTNL